MAGYCATGSTQEQCLFFLYGTGQNGKGTLVHTLNYVLKDYVANTAIETFAGGKFERHPEELAVLRGARMVLGSETTEGAGWNEGRLKQVTGGDLVRARFMRTNSFEYVPHFKLVISGNHLPTLASIDPAIERRFHIVPFNYRVPDHEKDQGLEEALRHEASGILQWVSMDARSGSCSA
jgi:putative DNA primase/helicase